MSKGLIKRSVDLQMLEEGDVVFGLPVRRCPRCRRPGGIIWEREDSRVYLHIIERVGQQLLIKKSCFAWKAEGPYGAFDRQLEEKFDPHDGQRKLTLPQRLTLHAICNVNPETGERSTAHGLDHWEVVLKTA